MMNKNEKPAISSYNPMGTDGFEFVEFSGQNLVDLKTLFTSFGFKASARHKSKDITLYQQGNITFIVNNESDGFTEKFVNKHGACACSFAIRVHDAKYAFERALSLGAEPGPDHMDLGIPSIVGIGGSLLYLVDQYGSHDSIYNDEFVSSGEVHSKNTGLVELDHLTHNVYRGNMSLWSEFYERLFNFREIRYFDIEGKLTGLKSKAMTSPCGKIRIPINESSDDKSQIEEYLSTYNGEGIQHIALTSDDIYTTIENMKALGVSFMSPPPGTYYDMLSERLPWHDENVERMKSLGILMDGAPTANGGMLLQIFTETVIGPIFFEVIQRKGDEGFGEGNFKALFESMERDQIKRGILQET